MTIYSDRTPSETTSSKAGGQWAVSVSNSRARSRNSPTSSRSPIRPLRQHRPGLRRFRAAELSLPAVAQSRCRDSARARSHSTSRSLRRMPFEGHTKPGFEYQTLLIEPPIFLPRLKRICEQVTLLSCQKKFVSRSDVLASDRKHHRQLHRSRSDDAVERSEDGPIKGQLAMLPAQPELQYLYGQDGYMFPRATMSSSAGHSRSA